MVTQAWQEVNTAIAHFRAFGAKDPVRTGSTDLELCFTPVLATFRQLRKHDFTAKGTGSLTAPIPRGCSKISV